MKRLDAVLLRLVGVLAEYMDRQVTETDDTCGPLRDGVLIARVQQRRDVVAAVFFAQFVGVSGGGPIQPENRCHHKTLQLALTIHSHMDLLRQSASAASQAATGIGRFFFSDGSRRPVEATA